MDNEQTLGSREARNKWRDVLDDTLRGKTTIVERNGREEAAVVPIDRYRQMKEAWESAQQRGGQQ
jgi:prevent-host-death family protein